MRRLAGLAAGVTAAAMIATPLARRRSVAREVLADVVVGGLATVTTGLAARRWGGRRAIVTGAGIAVATAVVEAVGTRTGVPFGRYRYAGRPRPVVAGVPVAVPAAWWAMALPAREIAHAALGARSAPMPRIALGAAALTAWDLFLDPQMTAEGYWRWSRRGAYRGVPLSNYVGWFVTGLAVMAALERTLEPQRVDRALVAEYAGMAVMETVGFAAFFRDPLVAAVGALGMVPVSALALLRGHR